MISYREKQLLMVMKMICDETDELTSTLGDNLEKLQKGENIHKKISCSDEAITDFDSLVELAKSMGYETDIRANDVLSAKELQDIDKRKNEIERKFKELVKLNKGDYAFLFSAVALNLIKQIFIKFDFNERVKNSTEAEAEFKTRYDKRKNISGEEKAEHYFAPTEQILNTKTVPYDIVKYTQYFNKGDELTGLGLSGKNHRFKTIGHDPLLGLVFGTANILTNTMTALVDKKIMSSYHVKYEDMFTYESPYVSSLASTVLMLEKVYERAKSDMGAIKAAFAKECAHIASDKDSKEGIPFPFVAELLGDVKARELALKGIDAKLFDNMLFAGEQAGVSVFINLIISMLHRCYTLWDSVKEDGNAIEAAKTLLFTKRNDFDKVRTKKVIMYSNVIASTINLSVCAGGGIIAGASGNEMLSKELFSHVDIGGLIITITTLFKDGKYILKVKDDFIKASIDTEFFNKVHEIQIMSENE